MGGGVEGKCGKRRGWFNEKGDKGKRAWGGRRAKRKGQAICTFPNDWEEGGKGGVIREKITLDYEGALLGERGRRGTLLRREMAQYPLFSLSLSSLGERERVP